MFIDIRAAKHDSVMYIIIQAFHFILNLVNMHHNNQADFNGNHVGSYQW